MPRGVPRMRRLDELIRRHLPHVRSLVFQMLLDDAAADDVTQEVFLKAIRGLERFDGRAKFSTWLYRICLNTTCTHLHKASRVRVAYHGELLDQVAEAAQPPDGRLTTLEVNRDIERGRSRNSPNRCGQP